MEDRQSQIPVQVQRGVLPDAIDESYIYLFKECSTLRLTYEIKLGTFMAVKHGLRLRLEVRPDTVFHPDLEAFITEYGVTVNRSLA